MPKKRIHREQRLQYFRWLVSKRNGVYYADGRSNKIPVGRHSLGTTDPDEASAQLEQLDLRMAVDNGLADQRLLAIDSQQRLSLAEGRSLYEQHAARSLVSGGPTESTHKRYRAVFDKFGEFAASENLHFWNQINKNILDRYSNWLDNRKYAYATVYLELTFLKQVIKYLITEGHLPSTSAFSYPLSKPRGSATYCWTRDEVTEMISYCRKLSSLNWLANVITALAYTGLRISELASLRWSDVNLESRIITLQDERTFSPTKLKRAPRTTKSGRDRSIPIHQDLIGVLKSIERRGDFVFHGPRGGRIKPDTIRRILLRDVLKPIAVSSQIPNNTSRFIDGRLHSFRHYFCSTCANEGISEQMVMTWLGHADSRMVRHYYHLHNDEAKRQMSRLSFVNSPGERNAG